MKTAFLIDSTMPQLKRIVERTDVYQVDLRILFRGEDTESRSVRIDDVFEEIEQTGVFPKTSLPSIPAVEAMLQQIKDDDFERIVVLPLSKGLSGTYQMLKLVCGEFSEKTGISTYILDTNVMNIANIIWFDFVDRFLQSGRRTFEELHEAYLQMKDHVHMYFVISDLRFIMQGGRLTRAQFLAGELLKVKPIMRLDTEGKVEVVERVRGMKKVIQRVSNIVLEDVKHMKEQATVFLTTHHSNVDVLHMLKEILEGHNVKVEHIEEEIDAATGVQVGPQTLVFAWANKKY